MEQSPDFLPRRSFEQAVIFRDSGASDPPTDSRRAPTSGCRVSKERSKSLALRRKCRWTPSVCRLARKKVIHVMEGDRGEHLVSSCQPLQKDSSSRTVCLNGVG